MPLNSSLLIYLKIHLLSTPHAHGLGHKDKEKGSCCLPYMTTVAAWLKIISELLTTENGGGDAGGMTQISFLLPLSSNIQEVNN